MEEDLQSSRDHCNLLESQLAMANDKVGDVEHSKSLVERISSERLTEITHLHKQMEEERVRDGLVSELKDQVSSLENQLAALQDKVLCTSMFSLKGSSKYLVMSTVTILMEGLL